jgi:hypothetical protein
MWTTCNGILVTLLRVQRHRARIVSVQQCTTSARRLLVKESGGSVDEEGLTIYRWANLWTADDVEQRIDELCADEPEMHYFVDTNVFISFGAGSHHE